MGILCLLCCWAFHVSACSYLYRQTQTPHLPTDSSAFPTRRWIFQIQSTISIFCMAELWIPLLLSKRCCMAGRTSCFPRRKVNSNIGITLDFEDSASRTFEFVQMVSCKNARASTGHRGDLKRVDLWEDIRSTISTPSFVWS